MPGGFILFRDDFAYVRFFAAIASARHPAPHWQPNFSSQARSGWFSPYAKTNWAVLIHPALAAQFLANSCGGVSDLSDYPL
jgi:hypothetical protein